jgi:hypothetical protein
VAGSIGSKRPVLSSWHKAYQKRTLSIGSEIPEDNYQRAIGASASEHSYPLALRPDPTGNHPSLSTVEICDTAGYLELIHNPNNNLIEEEEEEEENKKDLAININTHSTVNIPTNTLTISSVFLGALIIILIWYFKQKQTEYLREKSMITENSNSTTVTPPSTPEYHQLEQPSTPSFQSRYKLNDY